MKTVQMDVNSLIKKLNNNIILWTNLDSEQILVFYAKRIVFFRNNEQNFSSPLLNIKNLVLF